MKISYMLITLFIVLGMTIIGVENSWSDGERWEKYGKSEHRGGHDDDDDHDGRKRGHDDDDRRGRGGIAQMVPAIYKTECGDSSCHMAYPANLLPVDAWQKVMNGLEDHFGDNAELDPTVQNEITQYLVQNGDRVSSFRRSRSAMQSPLRITQMPYFTHEHDEISDRLIKDNPKITSLSNCDSCHERAELGFFDEDEVNIPGFGRWED